MLCKNQQSNPNNFPVGVLSFGSDRTEYDIQLMKQSDTSNIPDTLLTLGKKENYHACHNNSSSNPYRTLAWDDPDNPRSYNIRT